MTEKRYAAAMVDAIVLRMNSDPEMALIGSAYLLGPAANHPALNAVRENFPERIIDEPPIAESSVASTAIGAAMSGCRTLAHFGLAAFSMEAWSQMVNEAAVVYYQTGGRVKVPTVFTMMHGMMPVENSQHSRSHYAGLANSPGLQIVLASTPYDIKGLMTTALNSDNPTVVMNHPMVMPMEGEVPDDDYEIPFGEADTKREGEDVTIVATSHKVHVALAAADTLAGDGVSAEVIDPRTIVPLDREAILKSVRKTGRLVVVDDAPLTCGFAGEVAALAAESAFASLKCAVARLTLPDVPVPRSSQAPNRFPPDARAGR